uniref:Uncharacterized protein n=1 Tax=Octactis speculum TaxID=3111310 RepID=A0A7S2C367_9STRA
MRQTSDTLAGNNTTILPASRQRYRNWLGRLNNRRNGTRNNIRGVNSNALGSRRRMRVANMDFRSCHRDAADRMFNTDSANNERPEALTASSGLDDHEEDTLPDAIPHTLTPASRLADCFIRPRGAPTHNTLPDSDITQIMTQIDVESQPEVQDMESENQEYQAHQAPQSSVKCKTTGAAETMFAPPSHGYHTTLSDILIIGGSVHFAI